MEVHADFLSTIKEPLHRKRMGEVFAWVKKKYPKLRPEIKWNQPMFTDHGTFIIGFSAAKNHLSVAPENVTIAHLEDDIVKAGYDYTKGLVRIPWNSPIEYSLLEKMIDFNIWDKSDCTTFWRK